MPSSHHHNHNHGHGHGHGSHRAGNQRPRQQPPAKTYITMFECSVCGTLNNVEYDYCMGINSMGDPCHHRYSDCCKIFTFEVYAD